MKYLLLQIAYIYLHALAEVTQKNSFNKLEVVFSHPGVQFSSRIICVFPEGKSPPISNSH